MTRGVAGDGDNVIFEEILVTLPPFPVIVTPSSPVIEAARAIGMADI